MYEVFDDVFNSNGCFYDKSALEKNYDGDLEVLVFWNDEATQCLGAIAESRGERKKWSSNLSLNVNHNWRLVVVFESLTIKRLSTVKIHL